MKIKLTKNKVLDYHQYMAERFHFTVVEKSNSAIMPVISNALDCFGIVDKDDFMKRYATTVVDPFFDTKLVYVPWKPGHGSARALDRIADIVKKIGYEATVIEKDARTA